MVKSATQNPTEKKGVMLGRFDYEDVSYVTEAKNGDYTYYSLYNYDDIFKLVNESESEMFRINEKFIKEQFENGNSFYFSHDPNNKKIIEGKVLEQEIELLKQIVKQKYNKTAKFDPAGKYWKLQW